MTLDELIESTIGKLVLGNMKLGLTISGLQEKNKQLEEQLLELEKTDDEG